MRVLNLALTALFPAPQALDRSRSDLILENLALHQQVMALTRTRRRASTAIS
jgi:hypothetical protein